MKLTKRSTTFRAVALPLLILALLTGTLPAPACNKDETKKSLAVASEAAKDIAGGTRDTIKAVGQAFDKKLITLEQKDKLADLLIAISKGGQKGVAAISALEASGVTELDLNQASALNALFDTEVITPFLDLISELAKLSPSQSAAIRAALSGVRVAILLLSQKIGRNDVEQIILKREEAYA